MLWNCVSEEATKIDLNNFYHPKPPSILPSLMATRILWKCRYVSSLWHYLTSWSKSSLSRYGLLDHMSCEGVIGGGWGIILGGSRWVGVSGGGYCLIIPNLASVTSLQKKMLRIKCWEYKKVRDFLSLIQKQTNHFAGSLGFFWKHYFPNEKSYCNIIKFWRKIKESWLLNKISILNKRWILNKKKSKKSIDNQIYSNYHDFMGKGSYSKI